jgi:hypothetical protein
LPFLKKSLEHKQIIVVFRLLLGQINEVSDCLILCAADDFSILAEIVEGLEVVLDMKALV